MQKTKIPVGAAFLFVVTVRSVLAESNENLQPELSTTSFGMDTKVFENDLPNPIVETTTVFHNQRAYDVLTGEAGLVSRFDFKLKEIVLLDRQKQVFSRISFEDVLRFQAALEARVRKKEGSFSAFLAAPRFIREFDASNSTIKLSSPWLNYEAKGTQSPADLVDQFIEFADWSARVASMLDAAPPANARLSLNDELRKQNWQVSRVTRTGGPKQPNVRTARSEHTYREELSRKDTHLMEGIEKNLKTFREISFSDFRSLRNSPRVAAKK